MVGQICKKKKCKIKSAYINSDGAHSNLKLTLTGHEMAIAEASRLLEATETRALIGSHYFVERADDNKSLTITVALPVNNNFQTAADITDNIRTLTGAGLSGVYLQADFDQIGTGEKAIFSPAVSINITRHTSDPGNQIGAIALEIIKSSQLEGGYAVDPRHADTDSTRLFCMDRSFGTDIDAIASAEHTVREMEKNMGIHNSDRHELSLVSLKTSTAKNPLRHGHMDVAMARLQGEPGALDDAMRDLTHRHRARIAELGRGDNFIDIGSAKVTRMDPTELLAALHLTTGCHLPVEMVPLVTRSAKPPYPYEPVLETRIAGDESGLAQPTLRYAAARYAGSYIRDRHSVPEEMDPHAPAQVVVHSPHTSEETAKAKAESFVEQVKARFNGEISEGHNHHA